MRSNRVGVCVVALISVFSLRARAGVTWSPIDVGNVVIPATGMVTGVLADTANNTVDVVLTATCSGAGTGTFALTYMGMTDTTNIDLTTSQNIVISYTPTTKGQRQCRVDVNKHANGMLLQSFNILGKGLNPQTISVSSPPTFTTVRFYDSAPVHTAAQNIVVQNTGDVLLSVSSVVLGGTDPGDFIITNPSGSGAGLVTPWPDTVAASNGTHTWVVTFNPVTAGAKSATLTFNSDDPNTPAKVINLAGTGSTAIIGVTAAVNFGIVNTGNSLNSGVTITNNGTGTKGNLGVTTATIGNIAGAGAPTSWFTFSACSGAVVAGTCTFAPPLAFTTTSVVQITCSPPSGAAATDVQTATVTFVDDSDDGNSNPNSPATTLSCTAGKSMLATTAGGNPIANVAFSDTLILTSSATQTITVTNSGNVVATVSFSISGPQASNFSITAACGTGVQPACSLAATGGAVNVDLRFNPGAEGGLGATFLVNGAAPTPPPPPTPSLALSGLGIDRHILVAPMSYFPDTFRYPGSGAVPFGVTVMNTGNAPLTVSNLMVGDVPFWILGQTSTMLTIDKLSSMDVMVTFLPTSAGKQPDGRLVVTSDDRTFPMSTIALKGNGKDRNVLMAPTSVDIGDTGAGVPTKLSAVKPGDPLTITNMDPVNTFKIREILMEGDNVFEVTDLDGNSVNGTDLPPMTTKQFDVVFKPPTVGSFRANIALYLDEDPTSQTTIPVAGNAEFVDAHGGGGCSTGRGNGAGLVLVLGALALGRRRSNRTPIRECCRSRTGRDRRRPGSLLPTALTALFVFPTAIAHAQPTPTRNIELTVFDPTPTTSGSSLQLQTADVGASGDYVATAMATLASNPLVLGTGAADDPVVKRQTMMSIGGAYAFAGRFEAGAHMPLYLQSGDTVPMGQLGVPPASGAARGALALHAKARLFSVSGLRVGAALGLKLPTMSDSQFAGAEKPSVRLLALGSYTVSPRLSFDLNAGAVLRAATAFANIEQKSGLAWGVGASFRVLYPVAVTAELFGDVIPSGYHSAPPPGGTMGAISTLTTVEALVGGRWQAAQQLSIGLAAGRGVTSGIGTPDFRMVLTIAYAPGAPAAPSLIIIPPPPPPPVDHSNGDRDYDRIPDAVDKCPDQPEDKDGFEDEDGCPDLDNDKDGIPDDKDKCPNVAEDKDGFEDEDGCPDPDNDKDGIPDDKDKCPNQPETINGIDDDDGCPDKGESLIISSPERLELLEPIAFSGNGLAKASNNVLGQLAATLRARADILRVRITVHVQPTSSPDNDQKLSDKRAAAVREWLVKWGIVADRLEVKGFGGAKPLIPANQKGAAQVNDRIELIIIELDRGASKRH